MKILKPNTHIDLINTNSEWLQLEVINIFDQNQNAIAKKDGLTYRVNLCEKESSRSVLKTPLGWLTPSQRKELRKMGYEVMARKRGRRRR